MVALAGSAGVHAALTPSHAPGAPLAALLFAASALALTALVVVWPLEHAEPVDAIGVIAKLLETAGLVLALCLLQAARGSEQTLPALREGVAP